MATGTVIPVSEYLHTPYHPDCDYVDGVVEERNLGELDHSDLQRRLVDLLWRGTNPHYVYASQELRVQVSPTRFRVPDVCVRAASSPREQIVLTPPLLCIEVLSPEDTLGKTRKRAQDFFDMGVREVWIFDPATRTAYLCTATTMTEQTAGSLTVPNTPVILEIVDIFSVLDQA